MNETQRSGGARKSTTRTFLDLLADIGISLSAASASNFRPLAIGWLLNRGRGWISRAVSLARYFGCTKHHSALYRFFSRACWSPDAIGQAVFALALRWAGEIVEIAVDDTLCKRTGPHVWGAGVHIDPLATIYSNVVRPVVSKAFAFGHSWVVLGVRVKLPGLDDSGFMLPILVRLYRSKRTCPGDEYKKRTELAAQMIEIVRRWLPEERQLSVVGDHEYACKSVIRALPANVSFTGPLPKDARFYEPPPRRPNARPGRPRKRGEALLSPEELGACKEARWRKITVAIYSKLVELRILEQRGLWYSVEPNRICRMIIVRDPRSRYATRAIVTTDLTAGAAAIIERFSRRWLIEVMFRQAKQHLGLGQAQNGWEKGEGTRGERRIARERSKGRGHSGRKAVERTVPFVFMLQAAVVIHGLQCWRRKAATVRSWMPSWARQRQRPSFEDLLTHCRAELAAGMISPHPPKTRIGGNRPPPFIIALLAA